MSDALMHPTFHPLSGKWLMKDGTAVVAVSTIHFSISFVNLIKNICVRNIALKKCEQRKYDHSN